MHSKDQIHHKERPQRHQPILSEIERAIALGWLWRHESGTYVRFTDSGAALFA
jgi:hypothetical protein